jgi:hypothetical protein
MPSPSSPSPQQPSARRLRATIAFSCWLAASVLLIVGGLIAATVSWPGAANTLYRGSGVLTVIVGAAMAYLAGRSRAGDPRFRRAAMTLALAAAAVIAVAAAFSIVPVHLLTLAGVILLIAGTALNVQTSRGTGD